MIIIVDAGSTKSHLKFLGDKNLDKDVVISGINPFYQNEADIYSLLKGVDADYDSVTNVFHYGAGCSFAEKKEFVRNAWSKVCKYADIVVDSDMVGAAIALFGNKNGIACILGTGANSCMFKDGRIESNVPPLGFILGDEGSGANLGAHLVADCMKGLLPENLAHDFYERFNTSPQQIMDGVYKKQLPSRFLASFVPFLAENINNSYIEALVKNAFRAFMKRNVALYKVDGTYGLGFVGGVAKQFEPQLSKVACEFGFTNIKTLGEPMCDLASYYREKLLQK